MGGSSLEQKSNEILELCVPEKILNPANVHHLPYKLIFVHYNVGFYSRACAQKGTLQCYEVVFLQRQ